jgi:hypothetical protein
MARFVVGNVPVSRCGVVLGAAAGVPLVVEQAAVSSAVAALNAARNECFIESPP